MEWQGREESKNVEDRRGFSKTQMAGGGVGIIVVIVALIFGLKPDQAQKLVDPFVGKGKQNQVEDKNRKLDPAEEKLASFSKVIFNDTEVIWDKLFTGAGRTYRKPTLVLFTDEVTTACGGADSAVGPFYCPGDDRVYIDLSFYLDMERKLNAPGEFARAYVIAHEVGHHVQRLLGYSDRVDDTRRRLGPNHVETNRMSVRLELQADYLAGVWAHHGQKQFKFLQSGDIDSALNAAHQIGDDTLQKKGRGRVVPDSFTHGTSKQRMFWFKKGYETGDVSQAKQLFDLRYEDL